MTSRLQSTLLPTLISVLWAAFSIGGYFLLATRSSLRSADGGKSILQGYVSIMHLHEVPTTLAAPWFAGILLIAALGTPVVILISALLDRQGHSTRGLRWSLRTIPCLLAWLGITALCVCLAVALNLDEYVGLLIPAIWILSPFVYLRSDAIVRDRPPLFWLPGWPEIPAVVVAIVAIAVVYGSDVLVWKITQLVMPYGLAWWTLTIVLGLLALVIEMLVTAYALLAWKHRWRWSRLAPEFHFANLAPYARVLAAVDLQLGWITALLLIPLLLGAPGMTAFVDAYIEQATRLHVSNPPFYLSALTSMSRFFVSYWWMIALVSYGSLRYWIPFTSEARALHLAEAMEDSSHD